MTTPPPPPDDQPTRPGPPPGWGSPPPGPPPPPKTPRTFTGRSVLALTTAAFAVGLILGAVATNSGDGETSSGERPKAAATTRPPASTIEEAVTTSPGPTYPEPEPSDFKLTVKVLKKENFGGAGSNITFRIVAGWDKTYDPDKTYEVTYEVRGGEDGPQINTLEVEGDEYRTPQEEYASTSSTSARLTARVTSVEEA
jgi:hypothetical protein